MKGKNIVITGANAGIGFATSLELARLGANIFMICRNKEKAEQAMNEIKSATGNPNVKYLLADLSIQSSIRKLNESLREHLDRIDVLINNAGAVFQQFELTEDGIEKTIATNHFAYFLLSHLLLDLLQKSDYARIINVASDAHKGAILDTESFTRNKNYSIFKAYAQSKLANILFTREMAERLAGSHITVNCLHPGLVKTYLGNKNTNFISGLVWSLVSKIGGLDVQKGAATSVFLASSDTVTKVSGKYFSKCRIKEPSQQAKQVSSQKELWEVSIKLCPLN